MLVACIIIAVIFAILGLVFVSMPDTRTGGIIILIAAVMILISGIRQHKIKRRVKAKQKELADAGVLWNGTLKHFAGLPLAGNLKCNVYYFADGIRIEGANQTFNISKDKIMDISVTDSSTIQKSYASSVGGAVGGAVMFGPIGAMIGGRAKERTSVVSTYYLVITYKSGEEIKYVAFEITGPSIASANKLVNMFKQSWNSRTEDAAIDL